MLDLKRIKEEKEKITELLARKGFKADFDTILALDEKRREAIAEAESYKAERNKVSAEIPALKKAGKPVDGIFAEMRELGDKISECDRVAKEYDEKVFDLLASYPNIPDEDLLGGEKENNKVIKIFGEKPVFDFPMQNHVDLCTKLGIIDYTRGTKLSGGGYWLYRGDGARLEWALLNFFVQEHLKDGYEFILPPHQLGYNCGFGAGQFPEILRRGLLAGLRRGQEEKPFYAPHRGNRARQHVFGRNNRRGKTPDEILCVYPLLP